MDKILSNGVLKISVRQNLAPVVLRKVEWFWVKIINFQDLKILKKFFHSDQKLARTDTSGFLTYGAFKGIVGKILVYTFDFSKLQNSSKQLHTSGTSFRYGKISITIFVYLLSPPPQKKLGGTRLKIFTAPKNFWGFRLVNEKTRLKYAHFFLMGDSKYTNTVN